VFPSRLMKTTMLHGLTLMTDAQPESQCKDNYVLRF
jgi:hypothetical protein